MLETRPSSLPQGDARLRDGRRLAYAEYGDPRGRPVLFFHGTPGSRLFHHPDDAIAAAAGARIIVVDRPGFGRSDFKPGRKLLDWPDDVLQLADALKLTRFAVLGYSSGGAYAAACALSLPDRLTGIGLVSSVAPMESPEMTRGMHGIGHVFLNLERHISPLARLGTGLMCNLWRDNPEAYFKSQLEGLRDTEEARALVPGIKAMLTADFREAIRSGTDGVTFELKLLSQPWGFQPGAIKPEVLLWHGESDIETPVAMGKRLAGAIPHCRASFLPREGHWAIYVHWREILTALLANAGPAPGTMALHDLSGAPLSISTLSDPSADSGQGLPPAPPGGDTSPPDTSRGDTAARTAAPENRKMSIVEVIESLADAPPEVPADAPSDPAPLGEEPAPADAPAAPADDTEPAADAPPPADEPGTPAPAETVVAEAPEPPSGLSAAPLEEPAPITDSAVPINDPAPLAADPAPTSAAPEPLPEAPAPAAAGPDAVPEAAAPTADVPVGEAPSTPSRKKAARRGKAAPGAGGSGTPGPEAGTPRPRAGESPPAAKKKRPHAEGTPRGKAAMPEAKMKEKEDRPAPQKGKAAARPKSPTASGVARDRAPGDSAAAGGKAAAPARKPAKRAAGPAGSGPPGKAAPAPASAEPANRKPGAGRKPAREPVHA